MKCAFTNSHVKNSLSFVKLFAVGAFLFALFSCSQNQPKEIKRGIYYWKSNFALTKEELFWLKETSINRMYIRFFDVDWNPQLNSAVPVGDVFIKTNEVNNIEIVPVVFITNRTLNNIPDSLISELSVNIHKKIFGKLSSFKNQNIKEIQLDCDWTETTKEKYFNIIEHLKRLCTENKIEITVTVRLHQIKFFERTGVPPVRLGMLMFYNMSDVSNIRTINSIYDENIAKRYLVNFDKYPLDLDVALPAFSWACWFRNGKLKNLINDVTTRDLVKSHSFVKEDLNIFRATKDCFLKGNYILQGDFLRTEETDFKATLGAAKLIAPHIKNKYITISIYHLNREVIKNYGKDELEDIVSCFY